MKENCYICGEEREVAGYICQPCLDVENDKELEEEMRIGREAMEQAEKEYLGMELTPETAIRLMLDGITLYGHKDNWVEGTETKWDGKNFVVSHIELGFNKKPRRSEWEVLKSYKYLQRRKPELLLPMLPFECLVWANSPECYGWMVSKKYVGNDSWGEWDLPQRFKYDGQEYYNDPCVVSYRRARVLPDKSGIDESTIQGFLKEETPGHAS